MQRSHFTAEDFLPAYGLRNTHTQSFINSSGIRRRVVRKRSIFSVRSARLLVADAGEIVTMVIASLVPKPQFQC